MVSNESLSIAFLCLATQGEKEELLTEITNRYKTWITTERGLTFQRALELPNHYISEKIHCLQLALDPEKHGNKVREEMANRIAGSCLKQFPKSVLRTVNDEDNE
jgi:hypothetical protein